jgi:RHS repeat-associated protein
MMRRFAIILALLISVAAIAQQPGTGTPQFASIQSGGFDAVNRQNLNVLFSIPVVSTAGRGLNFSMSLAYNSLIWQVNGGAWSPVVDANGTPTWGWGRQDPDGQPTYKFAWHRCVYDKNQINGHYSNYKYVDGKGTTHAFSVDFEVNPDVPECENGHPQTGYATDGSGYLLDATDPAFPKVTSHAAMGIASDGPLKDANGNFITYTMPSGETDWIDTLGRTGLKIVSQTSPMATLYKYQDSNGTWQTVTMNLTSTNVKTNFGCSGISEYTATGIYLPTSIYLADGTHFDIAYEDTPGYSGYKTGRISQVTLPQGGYYQYSYGSTNDGINCSDGTVVSLTRVVNDGTTSTSWSYSRSYSSPNWVTTMTAPQLPYDSAANQSVYTFNSSGHILSENVYQGSATGTPLKTVSTSWSGNFPTEVDTTLGSVTSSVTSKVLYSFDAYGNPTWISEYDWGAASPTRTTTLSYETGSDYINANLLSLLTQRIVYAGSSGGTVMYRMDITHDGTTPSCVSGVAGHDDTYFGCGFNKRGNVTAVTVYASPSGPSGGLTTNYSYDTLGNMLQTRDPANNSTSFDYGDNWYGSNCSVTGSKAYPKMVTNALSQVKTTQYYTCTGAPRSVTDPNSQAVTYAYGSSSPQYGRLSSVTDPLSNATTMSYSGSTQSESTLTFNSSSSTADTLNVLDTLARPRLTQRKQSPSASSYDTTQVDYDLIGRAYKSYLPFNAMAGTTASTFTGTYYEFDALGRPTKLKDSTTPTPNVLVQYTYTNNDVYVSVIAPSGENSKRRQLEYDGLGRLKSVCEITSASGSGTCSQTSSQTGYWTTYSYDVLDNITGVSQNAQGTAQTRSYTYDGFNRMTQEVNPEAGTTTYVFDLTGSSACGGSYSSPGDLVRKADANGNNICYYYDALHRLTDVGPNGPNATQCKRFRYDNSTGVLGSIPSGVSVSNPYGRPVEAETDTCASPITSSSIITDEWFSYTARGETADVYQKTPNSGGYYHVSQTYWENGGPKQLSSSLSGLATITYNPDGEGRVYSVTASSGVSPVHDTTYNYASLPTAANFGTTTSGVYDSDAFTYDSSTNRMSQFSHSVNGQSYTGALTWNLNGSLSSQQITDQIHTGNSQTCSYTHDDLARIASVNCGTIWGQNFSFDVFGNISISVPTGYSGRAFQPTYTASTNHYATIPGATPSYDSNGNVLNDGSHGYVWNEDNQMDNIDSSTETLKYDALGRMVEQNRSGSYQQIVYGPNGNKLALMNGSTLVRANVPLPGGAQAIYTSSGLDRYSHADWLGSSRVISTPSRTVTTDIAYAPYGEGYGTGSEVYFTDQSNDSASDLYDFLFREHSRTQGRWISPDPGGLSVVDLSNPQSLNRYAYVMNAPTILVDPSGLNASADRMACGPNGELWWLCNNFYSGGTSWDGDQAGGGGFPSAFSEIMATSYASHVAMVDTRVSETWSAHWRNVLNERSEFEEINLSKFAPQSWFKEQLLGADIVEPDMCSVERTMCKASYRMCQGRVVAVNLLEWVSPIQIGPTLIFLPPIASTAFTGAKCLKDYISCLDRADQRNCAESPKNTKYTIDLP